ncbi:hypothetical protein PHAVU_004G096400 [Phaseolus vulgaris]|uniref:Uncharacterized protein n=1 Tax=Phaseolus vulgaris TaxID=3885 RepID=V7C541_PHAVU|nr:hypothetical protein PHAVU_004G096400g [Phaseolus vulgaris]ESW24031.1 hypothetical protein PHAVU_004G096400g [Phaseolus vulgaris]
MNPPLFLHLRHGGFVPCSQRSRSLRTFSGVLDPSTPLGVALTEASPLFSGEELPTLLGSPEPPKCDSNQGSITSNRLVNHSLFSLIISSIRSPSLGVKRTRLSPKYLTLILDIPPLINSSHKDTKFIIGAIRPAALFDIQGKTVEEVSKLGPLSTLHSLTILKLRSLHTLSSSHQWLQTITKIIQNLTELRLVDCHLSDNDIQSLFHSHSSNNSISLNILDLSSNILTSSTLQLCFPSLKILDLFYNNLTSLMFLGNFNISSKLQELYLVNCRIIDRSFLVSSSSTMKMNPLSSNFYLVLSDNLLKSCSIFHWLSNFSTDLHGIDLSGNLLEGPIPDEFGKVINSLQYLSLSNNKLHGKVPSLFGSMCRLEILDLSNNELNGEFPSFIKNSSWCNRHIFHRLNLSYNQITGKIPKNISLLSELGILSLEWNSLEGDVTESHLSSFSKLISLFLSHNSLSLKFTSSWVPPFQLMHIFIASCNVGPNFPSWLQTQNSVVQLDISDNGLNDFVPEWFWKKLQILHTLNMSHNSLIGKVPLFLLQASELLLSGNKFSDFLCGNVTAANLATLDLSYNQIKGQLPDCWKYVNRLLFLDLSSNQFLVLANNSLIAELPSSLKNCNTLIMLDVSENMLSGPIPSWVGESMQQLIILIMRGNHISGNLPLHLCYLKHIQLLDLSRNKLSEGIPTCLNNLTALSEKRINRTETESRVHWYNSTYSEIYNFVRVSYYKLHITLMWKGVERSFTQPELILQSIDLSCNNLIGEMPKEITYLLGLVSLNLSRNNLSGKIPFEIGNLSSLESLDLSRNHFYGRIPSSLSQLDFLQKLDLSQNSLSGRIPLGRHLDTFDATCCPGDETVIKSKGAEEHDEDDDSVFYRALYMSLGLGFFTGFWGLLGTFLLWQPWRIAYLRFLNRLVDHLLYLFLCFS